MKILEVLVVLAVAAGYAGWRFDARRRRRRGLPARRLARGLRIAACVVLGVFFLVVTALGVSSGTWGYTVAGVIGVVGVVGAGALIAREPTDPVAPSPTPRR